MARRVVLFEAILLGGDSMRPNNTMMRSTAGCAEGIRSLALWRVDSRGKRSLGLRSGWTPKVGYSVRLGACGGQIWLELTMPVPVLSTTCPDGPQSVCS